MISGGRPARSANFDRGRIRVLGAEPVVDREDLGLDPPADLRGQVGGLEGVAKDVHPAMEVQHDVRRLESGDGDLGGRDGAERARARGHVGRQRLGRCELLQ
jgi:hypothetical protein